MTGLPTLATLSPTAKSYRSSRASCHHCLRYLVHENLVIEYLVGVDCDVYVEKARDAVDNIELAWARVAPQLDTRPLGVTRRIGRVNGYLNRNAEEVFERFKTTGASMEVLAALFAAGSPFQLTPTDLYRGRMMSSAGMTA
ncbi:MAG TPA: hypothetical protein VEU77_04915, partial [Candidatus Acidoferrales bacterium]|nr:hypothetical protein [Candidatus Acidoferrales bacterium]